MVVAPLNFPGNVIVMLMCRFSLWRSCDVIIIIVMWCMSYRYVFMIENSFLLFRKLPFKFKIMLLNINTFRPLAICDETSDWLAVNHFIATGEKQKEDDGWCKQVNEVTGMHFIHMKIQTFQVSENASFTLITPMLKQRDANAFKPWFIWVMNVNIHASYSYWSPTQIY